MLNAISRANRFHTIAQGLTDSPHDQQLAVLHILSSAGIAGGERYVCDLMEHGSESVQHSVILPHQGPFEQVLKDGRHDYAIVGMKKRFSMLSISPLIKFISNTNVDIVHTHGYRANFYGRIACILTGTKSVATVHVSLYDYGDTPVLIRYMYMMAERILSRRTAVFICISDAMKRDTLRLGIDPQRIVVIQNGVDLERFHPRSAQRKMKKKLGLRTNGPVIGTVGRMVTEKGQIYLIEALKYLKREWKDLQCLFVGEGPLLHQLRKAAAGLAIEDMCIFAGIRRDIELIYPVLDLFVLPSLREPFGLVLLEAMASGIPVIATASGGPVGFIKPDVNGALVPAADPRALASKIANLLSDRNRAEAMAAEGRRTVEHEFSIRDTVKRVEQVYSSLKQAKGLDCNPTNT